jgi:predicted aspartyl protease
MLVNGFYDEKRNPSLTIRLSGIATHAAMPDGLIVDGVLDTGFAGFVAAPITEILPLGLPLSGMTPMILADSSMHQRLAALACVTVGGRALWGEVVLDPTAKEFLLGLEFLRTFNFALVLTDREICLIEKDDQWAKGFDNWIAATGSQNRSIIRATP